MSTPRSSTNTQSESICLIDCGGVLSILYSLFLYSLVVVVFHINSKSVAGCFVGCFVGCFFSVDWYSSHLHMVIIEYLLVVLMVISGVQLLVVCWLFVGCFDKLYKARLICCSVSFSLWLRYFLPIQHCQGYRVCPLKFCSQ